MSIVLCVSIRASAGPFASRSSRVREGTRGDLDNGDKDETADSGGGSTGNDGKPDLAVGYRDDMASFDGTRVRTEGCNGCGAIQNGVCAFRIENSDMSLSTSEADMCILMRLINR